MNMNDMDKADYFDCVGEREKDKAPEVRGLCCYCHEVHPVRYIGLPEDMTEEDVFSLGHGSEIYWVMQSHEPSFMAVECEGAGTTPQGLVRDE